MTRLRLALTTVAVGMTLQAGFPAAQAPAAIPAFPGAEGFGAYSVGGRGGKVIKVTNLNDSGPGSFRAAVTASGPRIVVFEVSGVIDVQTPISIRNGFITIAGETSPGGICLSGEVRIIAPHVIVRHVRFRPGRYSSSNDHGLQIWGDFLTPGNGADHVIVDHCSFSWAADENLVVTYDAQNVTVQWSISSQGLVPHSKGLLVSGKYCRKGVTVSLHHNYLAHNQDRNPLIGVGVITPDDPVQTPPLADVVNNVIYHWEGGMVAQTVGRAFVNWVHNYLKGAPTYRASHTENTIPIATHQRLSGWDDVPMLYVEGNISGMRPNQSYPDWIVGDSYWVPGPSHPLLGEQLRSFTRHSAPRVTTMTASAEMAATILSAVGARVPVRDSYDAQMVADFFASGGVMISSVTWPDSWPTYQNPKPPTDTDGDGMPDAWEVAHGLNPTVDDSAGDRDGDGYTNIEEYLHHLSVRDFVTPRAPANVRIR